MQPVRAFVGHSFTPEDDAVVRAFTSYLDTLRDILPGFSWDHAVRPEPSLVDEKVLEILRDKNVFIGICTKKELVVSETSLSIPFWKRDYWQARRDSFQWKTSDWIIQEIGLAIGRGLKTILLIEEGVKGPGSLQGNIEYITFVREAPEKAFEKLAGMLSAASGRARLQTIRDAAAEQAPVPDQVATEALPPAKATEERYEQPQPDWTAEDYETAVLMASGDEDRVRKIEEAFTQSSLSQLSAARDHFAAWKEYIGLLLGKGGDLTKLKDLASGATGERDSEINYFLGNAYKRLEEHSEAAATFERAADLAGSTSDAVRSWVAASNAWLKAGESERSERALEKLRVLAAEDESAFPALLEATAESAKERNEDDEYFAAMEAAIHLQPENSDLRFSLAFRYSEAGRDALALLHYSRIIVGARSSGAWNNLGFTLERLNVGSASIAAYKKAKELGETLAMSNMASRLLDVGFVEEAMAILNEAAGIPEHHQNIERQLVRAKEMPEQDRERTSELVRKAQPESDFYRGMGAASKGRTPDVIAGTWSGTRCAFQVSVTGTSFRALGTYEQRLGLISAAMGAAAPHSEQRFIEYSGTIRARAVTGVIRTGKVEEGDGPMTKLSSLLSTPEPVRFLAYFERDTVLQVLERATASSSPNFYTLKKTP